MSSIEPELVASIAAAPDEDGPRLVYADWLSDRDDPRGEFIVVECALAAADRDDRPAHEARPLHTRSTELMTIHRERWLAPVLDIAAGKYDFRRGFIEVMDVLHPDIDGARLHEACPLLRAIKTLQATVNEVLQSLDEILLDELMLYKITDASMLRRLLDEPRLQRLRHLDVRYQSGRPHPGELERLHLPLRRLALRFDQLQPQGEPAVLTYLMAHPARASLRSLELTRANAEALDALDRLPELEELTLTGCPFAVQELSRLALPRLTSLAITAGTTGALDPTALLAAFPSLRRLRLSGRQLGDRAVLALAASPHATRLRRLDLSNNQISLTGARALADSEHLRDLVWLDLTGNTTAVSAQEQLRRSLANAEVRL
jgi:uncharacterized protein (TIGR02996 family)